MTALTQIANAQDNNAAASGSQLSGTQPLLVLVEDFHRTGDQHRQDADAHRNDAAVVAQTAAQLAIKKVLFECCVCAN